MRIAITAFLAVMLAGCPPSDTGLVVDSGDTGPVFYEGIGPQTAACTYTNCCAIISGAISCKGADSHGLNSPPSGVGWVGIESSARYLCAWNAIGDPTCWGDPFHPYAEEMPDVLVADIRLGAAGGITLLTDGSISVWGSDTFGQLSNAPDPVGPYIAVEAGFGWRCVARDTGDLTCWGIEGTQGVDWIEHAQVDHAPTDRGFRGLSLGIGDVLSGIDIDDRVYSWGGGYEFAFQIDTIVAASVAPSEDYVCAQLPTGQLVCAGELIPALDVGPEDTTVPPAMPATAVACGYRLCGGVFQGALELWGAGQASAI